MQEGQGRRQSGTFYCLHLIWERCVFVNNTKKMNGAYFAGFIRRSFKKIMRKSCNPADNLFVQDDDSS